MNRRQTLEITVGLFVLAGLLSLLVLAFKVSGLTSLSCERGYDISAEFSNIGDLKVRAPVTIAGVKVGEVTAIALQANSFAAKVVLRIDNDNNKIPANDTSAQILTQGLLGSNYVSITPGFESDDASNNAAQY